MGSLRPMFRTLGCWEIARLAVFRLSLCCTPVYGLHDSISVARWAVVQEYVSFVLHRTPVEIVRC